MTSIAHTAASPSAPDEPASAWLVRYRRWQKLVEVCAWTIFFCGQAALNSITVWLDIGRMRLGFADWEPVVWEWSSNLVLLALVPAVIAAERRWPVSWRTWRKTWAWHLLASVVFSLVHVICMVALRKAAYASQSFGYDFGNWPLELTYEYLKDFRTYLTILAATAFYRLLLIRIQGEATLLDGPEVGEAVDAIERPERFLVKTLGKEFLLPASEVEWLQAWGNYVNLHVRGRDYPLRTTMASITQRIDPSRFVRVHRSYIVNLDYITEIEPMDSGDAKAHMRGGASVPVSRRLREELRDAITGRTR